VPFALSHHEVAQPRVIRGIRPSVVDHDEEVFPEDDLQVRRHELCNGCDCMLPTPNLQDITFEPARLRAPARVFMNERGSGQRGDAPLT
jgi:hypothetical protein